MSTSLALNLFSIVLCAMGAFNAVLLFAYSKEFGFRWWVAAGVLGIYIHYVALIIDWYINNRDLLPEAIATSWSILNIGWISLLGIVVNFMTRDFKHNGHRTSEHRAIQR